MDRKKRLFNRVLLVSGASALLLFVGYVYFTKRSPRHYLIPKNFEGWVTIKYEKPNAPPLPEKEGVVVLEIPASGILETSSPLPYGWSRDDFFWREGTQTTKIPRQVQVGEEPMRQVHDRDETHQRYDEIILGLPEQIDTVLWDGAKISKSGEQIDLRSGRNTLEHFFISSPPPTILLCPR